MSKMSSSEEASSDSFKICIIGAGFSGLATGIKLAEDKNLQNFTIFDENDDVGGTWLIHTYPGCACDVSSLVYSYSFEPNPNWSNTYPSQPEILEYLKGVARKYDMYSKIKFKHRVTGLHWDDSIGKWRVKLTNKITNTNFEEIFDIVCTGIGAFREPNIPKQFNSFKGPIVHTARWDHDLRLENKVVAVIGSGCSAVQVIPELLPKVKRMLSFQRKPAWVVPQNKINIPEGVKKSFRVLPFLQWFLRIWLFFLQEFKFLAFKGTDTLLNRLAVREAKMHLKSQIPDDPKLRQKLLPNYAMGCKRIAPSNTYLKSFVEPNTELILGNIDSVKDHSIVSEDGEEYEVDVIVLATGYNVQDFWLPMDIKVRNNVDLLDIWRKYGPQHYLGIVGSTAPNLFSLLGPNTAYGHNSVIFAIECQVNWISQVLKEMNKRGSKVVSVKKSVEEEYVKNLRIRMQDTVWGKHQCGSWYADKNGIITALYPGNLIDYWKETKDVVFSNLEFE